MIKELLCRYPVLGVCENDIISAKNILTECYKKQNKLLLCGNGGSCADCDHIVGELMKGFLKKRSLADAKRAQMKEKCPEIDDGVLGKLQNALPAVSLSSFCALNTAFSNDVDAELIYAQTLYGLAKEGDVLIAISTSGNSKNVLQAAKVARAIGVKVISLTGKGGGKLRLFSDVCIAVPESETYKVQELHLPVYHALCAELENEFFVSVINSFVFKLIIYKIFGSAVSFVIIWNILFP